MYVHSKIVLLYYNALSLKSQSKVKPACTTTFQLSRPDFKFIFVCICIYICIFFVVVFVFLLPFVFVFEVFEICLLHQPSFMYQSSSQLLDPHFKFRNWIRINSCHCHQGPDQGCHFETVSTTAVLESDFHFIFATL